jgi:TatD DNase family protein
MQISPQNSILSTANKLPAIIDSHCHFNGEGGDALNMEIAKTMQEAEADGVVLVQNICTHLSQFEEVYKIALQHPCIFASVGTHPLNVAQDGIAHTKQIINFAQREKVTAIGETGLDYSENPSVALKNLQKENFIAHIQAAQETKLPLVVHARDADHDIAEILQTQYAQQSFPFVMHCFTSSPELAEKCLKLGAYFSASGIITFKNAIQVVATFRTIPNDKLIIETDAPFLAPVPYRGKPNRPAYVKYVCAKLAEIKGTSYEAMADTTTKNFFKLYKKAHIESQM